MDDQELLTSFARTRDAAAFEELTRRHKRMVHAVCHRVLGNVHDAEEVSQECFLQLARHADGIRTSVVGWLHRAATSRSLNRIRSRSRSRVRERKVSTGANTTVANCETSVRELRHVVAGAMTDLPEDLRLPVQLHYFDGQSQRDVAKTLGVNQSTISRRMQEALQLLRNRLTRAGFVTTSPVFMFSLQSPFASAEDQPQSSRAVVEESGFNAIGLAACVGWLKSTSAAILAALIFLTLGGWVTLTIGLVLACSVAVYRPNWLKELCASLGWPDVYRQSTFSLRKWDWTEAPLGWRRSVATSSMASVFFAIVALVFAIDASPQPGTVVLGIAVSVWYAIHAMRVVHRVYFCSAGNSSWHRKSHIEAEDIANDVQHETDWSAASLTGFDLIQLFSAGVAAVAITAQSMIGSPFSITRPVVALVGAIGVGMVYVACHQCRRLVRCGGLRWMFRSHVAQSHLLQLVPISDRTGAALSSTDTRQSMDERQYQAAPAGVRLEDRSQLSTNPVNSQGRRRWKGTEIVLAICAPLVLVLSASIAWNPNAVKGLSQTLAAIQALMLGWIVYRLAVYRRREDPSIVRFAAIVIVITCFVMNSTVCYANWPG